MIAYRFEMHTAEQVAALDPFAGAGVQLGYDSGLTREQAEPRLLELFGATPYVAFPACAWLDSRGLPEGLSPEGATELWGKGTVTFREQQPVRD